MPINPNSRLRKVRKVVHGWTAGGKFYTSLQPRAENAPKNEHATARDALMEATRRHLTMVWENPEEIA